jgi:hypothetical protein
MFKDPMNVTKNPEYDLAEQQGKLRNFRSIYCQNHRYLMKGHGQGKAHSMSMCCELCIIENNEIMGIYHIITTLDKLKINLTNQLLLEQCCFFSFSTNLSTRAPM